MVSCILHKSRTEQCWRSSGGGSQPDFVSGIISFETLLKIPAALICTGASERKAPTEKIYPKLYLRVLTTLG